MYELKSDPFIPSINHTFNFNYFPTTTIFKTLRYLICIKWTPLIMLISTLNWPIVYSFLLVHIPLGHFVISNIRDVKTKRSEQSPLELQSFDFSGNSGIFPFSHLS